MLCPWLCYTPSWLWSEIASYVSFIILLFLNILTLWFLGGYDFGNFYKRLFSPRKSNLNYLKCFIIIRVHVTKKKNYNKSSLTIRIQYLYILIIYENNEICFRKCNKVLVNFHLLHKALISNDAMNLYKVTCIFNSIFCSVLTLFFFFFWSPLL
jgi:hypothetical protein